LFEWFNYDVDNERRNVALQFAIDLNAGRKTSAETIVNNAKIMEAYLEGSKE
jgi:hypothetical protein